MPNSARRLLLSGLLTGAVATGGMALFAGGAGAGSSSETLHFFAKSESESLTNAFGQPVQVEAAHDQYVDTDLDYVGTHSSHAKNWTASDHEFCSFTTVTSADCFGEFAIGGSMVFADNFTLNSSSTGTVAITGATGQFAGDTGTISMKSIAKSQNSDVTIVLHKR
jgi:hypothetical protein